MAERHGIRWTPSAYRDLKAAHAFVRRRNPTAARELAARIRERVAQLAVHPELGPVAEDLSPDGPYRHLIVLNYRIVYRQAPDGVIVLLRIWDTRRDPTT
ncbi:MAG: type II toxin-antitoxin system RelE/ParE family toxin [Deltaproteobacteria bacterium]|nr:type II toxin-antitoxin system RelE/ParE family toxin [Deltaproteobacteria bacterium]